MVHAAQLVVHLPLIRKGPVGQLRHHSASYSVRALVVCFAIAALEGMDAMSSTLSRFRAVQEATAYNNAAIDLLHVGRTAEAAAGFRAAVSVQPDGPEAYYNLGIAYKDQGRHQDSVRAYSAALALRPSFPEASFNAGRALQMLTDDPGPLGLLRPGLYATQGSNPRLAVPRPVCSSHVWASPCTGTRRAGRHCSRPRRTSRRRRRRSPLHRSEARAPYAPHATNRGLAEAGSVCRSHACALPWAGRAPLAGGGALPAG